MKASNSGILDKFHQLELKLSIAMEGAQKDIQYIKHAIHLQ
jgi:hypothetical protein